MTNVNVHLIIGKLLPWRWRSLVSSTYRSTIGIHYAQCQYLVHYSHSSGSKSYYLNSRISTVMYQYISLRAQK